MRLLALLLILINTLAWGQSDGISPQFWNNAGFGWNINQRFSQNNELAYNFLADKEFTWSEFSYWGNVEYSVNPIIEGMAGLYLASTNQDLDFRTNEARPFFGFRIHSSVENRFSISNLSRFEFRFMYNNDNGWNPAFRFRNRTTAAVAINKPSLNSLKMLSVFGFFEVFSNSQRVEERFFTQLKYKFGLAYRFTNNWRMNIGTIFQQSENSIDQPVILPTSVETNMIIELGASYRLIRAK